MITGQVKRIKIFEKINVTYFLDSIERNIESYKVSKRVKILDILNNIVIEI